MIYGLTALYFLYQAAMGIFVYFANKSLGHTESFFMPGRNLMVGLVLAFITCSAWYLIQHQPDSKTGFIILYLPTLIIGGFFLFMIVTLILSGGKWN
jgi:FtsH-binding integral membrane protein